MPRFLAYLGLLLLVGCASPAARIDKSATRAGLIREVMQGRDFRHVVYLRDSGSPIWTIFLEGDGLPWIDGRSPADDPTTRNPLALRLMLQAKGSAMYVSRPCYHDLKDAGCSWQSWTAERYSEPVVASMAAAIESKLRGVNAERVRLVGYSGGGVLAVLIAERLAQVERVVTIAANLDIDAWTRHHGYLPLTGSLNPAASAQPHIFREIHLQGADDDVVPRATTEQYFARYPNAIRHTFDEYGHICCWERDWLTLQRQLEQ